MNISARTKRLWRNRLIFVGLVVAGIAAYIIYINSFTIYDYSHLNAPLDFGAKSSFAALSSKSLDDKVLVAQTDSLELYICEATTEIAVVDLRNGHTWYSTPKDWATDSRANPYERNSMRSNIGFGFYNELRQENFRWLFPDSVAYGLEDADEKQFEMFSIPDGVRIEYVVGDLNIGIDALPFFIPTDMFKERIEDRITESSDRRFIINNWFESETLEGYYEMTRGIRDSQINTKRMLELFESLGWTAEDTRLAREASGVYPDIDFDLFDLVLEFKLDGDRLVVNMPLSEFTATANDNPFIIHFMKFFGAGSTEDDGFILVPSGSGGIINFNNGKHREEPFRGAVYGLDNITNIIRPQVLQPIRLPVLGIRNNGAAILAHVENGSAIATVNAEVSGRTNSYNSAWFSFTLRASTLLTMPGGGADMAVVQNNAYEGDITVSYHFIADENASVGGMAQAYQNYLVEQGVLTPLSGAGDRSFYMDVVGAIDILRHFVGTPYITTEVMTTIEEIGGFVDELNAGGVNRIQTQLHGWFNRGINHDVAKSVKPIDAVGSRKEMLELHERLRRNGGGLHPAVGFQFTNYYSRNFNDIFEASKDLAGYVGFMTRHTMRDSFTVRLSDHRNDWYVLVHPGVLPFHVEKFVPSFLRRTNMDSLMLSDLGNTVNESLFRRDSVDRQSSKLIVQEQIGVIKEAVPNLVISGGNDYSLAHASHLVDVPTQSDWQYIIDYEVPFFSMVVHGFIEFAGKPINQRENFSQTKALLNSMATGASPRYAFTQENTRQAQFSPHERMYSTQFENWKAQAIRDYLAFNDVYADLRAERMVDFTVLAGSYLAVGGEQVTVTEFSNGTRIYVNSTDTDFYYADGNFTIGAESFTVKRGGR